MIEIALDQSRNLMTVSFSKRVTPDETRSHIGNIRSALAQLQPGFQLLTDLSQLDAMDLGCAPDIEKVMDQCNAKGIAKVVRVIPDPQKDIGLNIMSMFHYNRGVRIVTCDTVAEAEEALAN